jgi:hypothetical protein
VAEQLKLAPVVKTEEEQRQAKEPAWVEPDIPDDAIGGIVAERSDVQYIDKFPKSGLTEIAKEMWSPRFGIFKPWFDVVLQYRAGYHTVSVPADWLYKVRFGDWMTIKSFKVMGSMVVAQEIEVIEVPRHPMKVKLDVEWIGPQSLITGEGKIGIGTDNTGRQIYFSNLVLSRYFGKVPRREKTVILTQLDDLQPSSGGYYGILGISPPVDDEEVKTAFRTAARETHPDLNPDDEGAGAKFQEVHEAYEFLKTAENRNLYDMMMNVASSTYAAQNDEGIIRQGQHKDQWYPPVTSGIIRGIGVQIGNSMLIQKIDDVEVITEQGHTRVAADQDGMTTVAWAVL